MAAALWLVVAPLLGIETGFRAGLSVACGVAAILLSLASIWRFGAGIALTALAFLLSLVNFLVEGTFGGMASYASCAVALAVAGMAPIPHSASAPTSSDENTPLSHDRPPLTA
jgi:hypothetical protein